MKQEQDKSAKKRDRRMLGVAGGAFALAACVFGGLYTQRNAAQGNATQRNQLPHPPAPGSGYSVPDISPEVKAQYIERAKLLRQRMEPWVRTHQEQIQRMLSAAPSDTAAVDAVWQLVPVSPGRLGLTADEMMPSGDPLTGVGFGWVGVSKVRNVGSNPDAEAMAQKISGMATAQLQHDFKVRRDMAIAGASGGHTRTYLWISGRITQVTELEREERMAKNQRFVAEGRTFGEPDIWGPVKEVAPPYDFLSTSTNP